MNIIITYVNSVELNRYFFHENHVVYTTQTSLH